MKKSLMNSKGKDLLRFSLVALLLLSITSTTTIVPVHAVPQPKIFVDPPEIITNTTFHPASTNFTVEVRIANITNLAGVDFKLYWDPTLLSGVSMEEVLFTENTPPGEEDNIWKLAHTVTSDHVEYSYTYMNLDRAVTHVPPYLPINITDGWRTLAIITLRVEKEPTKTEGYLDTALTLTDVIAGDMEGVEIPSIKENGYFKLNWTQPTTKPYLSVEPDTYVASRLNETFDISVAINNLEEGWELVGLEFKLGYNTSILEVLEVKNGTFFEPFGATPNGGVFYFKPPPEYDFVNVGVMVLPDENGTWHTPFPSGSGVVATICFKAIYGNFSEVIICDLDLYDIIGGDTTATPIPFDPEEDGYYRSAIGDNILPSIGTPSREPEGDVLPDQEVKVSVNVTDADSGVKNVTLSYTTNDGISWNNVTMIYNSTTSLYEGLIPGQPADTTVKYKIIAYDKCNNSAVEDKAGEYYVYVVIPEFKTWLSLFVTIFIITTSIILIKRKWKPHRLSIAKQNT